MCVETKCLARPKSFQSIISLWDTERVVDHAKASPIWQLVVVVSLFRRCGAAVMQIRPSATVDVQKLDHVSLCPWKDLDCDNNDFDTETNVRDPCVRRCIFRRCWRQPTCIRRFRNLVAPAEIKLSIRNAAWPDPFTEADALQTVEPFEIMKEQRLAHPQHDRKQSISCW